MKKISLAKHTSSKDGKRTFQDGRADVEELHFVLEVSLVYLPKAGNERFLFCRAAGHPLVHLVQVQVKLCSFLYGQRRACVSICDAR